MDNRKCALCGYRVKTSKCLAYPKGIPERYMEGEKVHDTVQKDQQGTFTYDKDIRAWDIKDEDMLAFFEAQEE